MKRIALVGYMGAGKTTVGELVAQELGWEFCDLDQKIQQQTKTSIAELFAKGEEYFRAFEAEALKAALEKEPLVLATGGGVVERSDNLKLLLAKATVVYLKVPVAILWQRTGGEGAEVRPLLQAGFPQFAARFKKREPNYQAAHWHLDGREDPKQLAQRIVVAWRDGSGHNQTKPGGE